MNLPRLARTTTSVVVLMATCALGARAQTPTHADSPRVLEALPAEAQRVLLEADTLEVLLLVCERPPAAGEEAFHGYPVVRRVTVEPGAGRVRLLSRLYQGIDEGSAAALCFEPHHGVRARKGEQQVDLVICFECLQQQAHGAGVRAAGAIISRAAAAELERLLGPIEVPRPGGRTLEEWQDRLEELASTKAALEPDDEAGVVALAESLDWPDVSAARRAAETLSRLGPRAAPAAPALARYLRRGDVQPRVWEHALGALKAMGPAAAPAVPALIALLERDLGPLIERARRYHELDDEVEREAVEREGPMLEEDEALELRITTAFALGEIGAPAAPAVSLLETLAATDDDLGLAARESLSLIRRAVPRGR